MLRSLVGSEMCIRDRVSTQSTGVFQPAAMGGLEPNDWRMLLAAAQANDLQALVNSPLLSQRLSLPQLVEHWHRLLYDDQLAKMVAPQLLMPATHAPAQKAVVPTLRGPFNTELLLDREVVIGRSTREKDGKVQVDVSSHPDGLKVSRKHVLISRGADGALFAKNIGKRLIRADGEVILRGNQRKLEDSSDLNVCGIRFRLSVHPRTNKD
eukprot:TRINITY_DN28930_c0_g1_i1.p1 TRINITY_DN28930_c0_g1~~TRINITY_DN28930_c0_g1_i1.p1  ORF type:complete len:210 (+),score=48.54 TRINITY_DN28930_c0_g1_i1:146-775(+)